VKRGTVCCDTWATRTAGDVCFDLSFVWRCTSVTVELQSGGTAPTDIERSPLKALLWMFPTSTAPRHYNLLTSLFIRAIRSLS
jgi:hypothetical protein